MKLDYDLIRDLLILIEEITDGTTAFEPIALWEEDYKENINYTTLYYHLKYLSDAGFIEVIKEEEISAILDITPHGREYLCHVRSSDIWGKTKKVIQPFGNVTFSLISDIAKSYIKSSIGIP